MVMHRHGLIKIVKIPFRYLNFMKPLFVLWAGWRSRYSD